VHRQNRIPGESARLSEGGGRKRKKNHLFQGRIGDSPSRGEKEKSQLAVPQNLKVAP